jgi:hypothetical protein
VIDFSLPDACAALLLPLSRRNAAGLRCDRLDRQPVGPAAASADIPLLYDAT